MTKFMYANMEQADGNEHGIMLTIYFEGVPTVKEVKSACLEPDVKKIMSVNIHDEQWFYDICPTWLSDYAVLTRIQVGPGW